MYECKDVHPLPPQAKHKTHTHPSENVFIWMIFDNIYRRLEGVFNHRNKFNHNFYVIFVINIPLACYVAWSL